MAYQPSEKKAVEEPCVSFARKTYGIKVLKVNPLWAAGWNDRIFFIPGGKVLIIEFKRPGGKTSKLQDDRHRELLEAGYDHHVCDSKEEGIALIRARMEAHSLHETRNALAAGTPVRRTVPRSRAKKN